MRYTKDKNNVSLAVSYADLVRNHSNLAITKRDWYIQLLLACGIGVLL